MAEKQEEFSDIELFNSLSKDKETSDKAFKLLYERYSSKVYAYCRRFLGNKEQAQDVFQETFIRFYQAARQERVMTNVHAFLLRIARNLCINEKRNEKNNVDIEEFMLVQNPAKDEKQELLELIKMALDLLPDEYREMFILREYQGLTYSEIVDLTGASIGTVKIRIYRAKQKIRKILAPYLKELSQY